MAEGGILGHVFGHEEGEDAEDRDLGIGGADPLATAAVVNGAQTSPELGRRLGEYVERQGRLVDRQAHLIELQTEHLHEQRAVQLDHLKLRRVGERMRVAIQAFFVTLGALIGLSFLLMVWGAVTDHGLVVEPFSVPPELGARGLTGQVVAKQVLDRLADMQAQSATLRAADTYRNNWGDDLKVEIPETGVSVGEVRRWLNDTLGHETRISGEVWRSDAGLTITARTGEDAAKSFTGPDADLNKLVDQVSEELFHRTQPYRYGTYLKDAGRFSEAEAVFRGMFNSTSLHEQAWAHIGFGGVFSARGDDQTYANECKEALALVPHFAPALTYLSFANWNLEHESDAVRQGQAFLAAQGSIGRDIAAVDRLELMRTQSALIDCFAGNEVKAIEEGERLARSPSFLAAEGWRWTALAKSASHDFAGARAAVSHVSPDDRLMTLEAILVAAGDPSGLALAKQVNASEGARYGSSWTGRNDAPWLALALAQTGDVKSAEAVIAATPMDCDLCLRTRGTLASMSGDRARAENWFAQAIARTPDLPWAYAARGQARFRAGDLEGALADARAATQVSPHFADGYALQGDVLAWRHRWTQARDSYNQALRYAPAWTAARRSRDEVAART